MPIEITELDFISFIAGSKAVLAVSEEENAAWLDKNGISIDLIRTFGMAMGMAIRDRVESGQSLENAMYHTSITAFQMGWEAYRHFRSR